MYNLLTGYHLCTNRAVFLMLPRPHTLQPTEHRSFIQGIRSIEGIQEFFLIVQRPDYVDGLCIETSLETGHFPEDVPIYEPPSEYDYATEKFEIRVKEMDDFNAGRFQFIYHIVKEGYIIDETKGDEYHPGILEESFTYDGAVAQPSWFANYNYNAITSDTVQVQIVANVTDRDVVIGGDPNKEIRAKYTVFLRTEKPKRTYSQAQVNLDDFFITHRSLCACMKSGEDCPEILPIEKMTLIQGYSIVYEGRVSILSRGPIGESSKAAKMFVRAVGTALTNSPSSLSRIPFGKLKFFDSDFVKDRLKRKLPDSNLNSKQEDMLKKWKILQGIIRSTFA